ncbi:MAG: hypothetical protein P8049_04885 [Gemmatimonadota bacterium]
MKQRSRRSPESSALEQLSERLLSEFESWRGECWSDEKFEALALEIFALQFAACSPYRSYCAARGASPETVADWRRIPPVPAEAFRHVEFRTNSTGRELRFRTSGTTGGSAARGIHIVPEPALYRASLRGAFRQLVLRPRGEGYEDSRHETSTAGVPLLVSLVPRFDPDDGSSLAWMLDDLIDTFGRPGSRSVASARGIDWSALFSLCDAVAGRNEAPDLAGTPVILLGTTLSFDAFRDRIARADRSWQLPPGSILMDTGGVKGRDGLDRDDTMRELLPRLGIEPSRLVNEFGMTELLSQRYGWGTGLPKLVGPPWLRTRVLDPVNLEPRPAGSEGILCHYDLANAGSAIGVLTEDRGVDEPGGIRLLGRTPGSPPRGCSLATAELLRARERE